MVLTSRVFTAGLLFLLVSGLEFASQDHMAPLPEAGQRYSAPFAGGERLRYEVYWKPMFLLPAFKAGELDFRTEETVYQSRPVYKVMAEARSSGRLADIAGLSVRDYFESIFDRATFKSYRLIKKLREGKRQRDFELLFDYPDDRLLFREDDVATKPPRELRKRTIPIAGGPLVDVVSVFYVGRLLPLKIGAQYFTNVVDEGEPKRVEFSVVRAEEVKTPIGAFKAVRINTNGQISVRYMAL
jgi:hypothetical protein